MEDYGLVKFNCLDVSSQSIPMDGIYNKLMSCTVY